MKITSLLLVGAAVASSVCALPAVSLDFSATTTGAPTYNRATEPGDDISAVGTEVPFFAQSFTVGKTGAYNLSVIADDPSSFDTFIHLYAAPFNASLPLSNILSGNDDAVFGSPELGSAITGQPLVAGGRYVLVVDGFGNFDFGAFKASISGPGTVSVPDTTSTTALLGLSVAGLGLMRRRVLANA